MHTLVLQILLLVTPGAKKMPLASGRKIPVKRDASMQPYTPENKPSFFYLARLDPQAIRSHLKITGKEKKLKAQIKKIKHRKNAFERVNVSYAAILSNLKTIEEWKETQERIRRGEIKNVQMAKLNMEERVRKTRLELVKRYGTWEEYQSELESFRKFEAFKANFLKNKEVRK